MSRGVNVALSSPLMLNRIDTNDVAAILDDAQAGS
jgi:hypothetical protein